MQAIILCAGKSSRLGEITKETPKSLLDISGKCSLGRQIENLRDAGVKDIMLVTGYMEDKIQAYIDTNRKSFGDVNIVVIYNADWETTNNGWSLNLGLEVRLKDHDTIVLNADVVCYKDLIKELVNHPSKNAMAVVRKKQVNEEDMKVIIEEGKVIDVSKQLPLETSFGEFTGIFKMGKEIACDFRDILWNTVIENRNAWFEHALVFFCKGKNFDLCDVSHYPYIEVDFPEDLEIARDRFQYNLPVWEQGRKQESIQKGSRNIEDCISLMSDFVTVLNKYNIRHWLNWGLLLGCVREGQPLQFDTDLDICIDKENEALLWEKVVPEMRQLRCFIPAKELHCDNDCFMMRDGEAIECNTMEKIGDKYVYSPDRSKLSCPAKHIDTLDTIVVKGHTFNIPSDVDKYLTGWYGNWRVPASTKPSSF